ncbi:MAG: tRNA (adenosine(37)-N6)-threonylcarbamoyltransferase complex dimerization subunit type 1 TsaB [Bacteroidetes bacterium]|nr:tRNA (adenosine(37)-N6)-threonylcarbamoyltransferase complex dimerization subunit type 1 TsaB [Bacteroidota bacterium]
MLAAIETTGDTCGVALFDGNTLRTELYVDLERAHDRLLASLFQQALEIAGARPSDIEHYAVSVGPGSYTGIRIGIAFAIGAALAAHAGMVAVPTLGAIAFDAHFSGQLGGRSRILSLIPAGREGLYAGLYDVAPEFRLLTAVRTVPEHQVPTLLNESIVAAGPGIAQLGNACIGNVVAGTGHLTARSVGRYGLHLHYNGETTTPADIRPLYISDFKPKVAG